MATATVDPHPGSPNIPTLTLTMATVVESIGVMESITAPPQNQSLNIWNKKLNKSKALSGWPLPPRGPPGFPNSPTVTVAKAAVVESIAAAESTESSPDKSLGRAHMKKQGVIIFKVSRHKPDMAHTKCFAFVNIFISSFQSPPIPCRSGSRRSTRRGSWAGSQTGEAARATVMLKEDSYKFSTTGRATTDPTDVRRQWDRERKERKARRKVSLLICLTSNVLCSYWFFCRQLWLEHQRFQGWVHPLHQEHGQNHEVKAIMNNMADRETQLVEDYLAPLTL